MKNYFSDDELKCHCCGVLNFNPNTLRRLNLLRKEYGKPIMIESGYRCPKHNKEVSDTGESGPHTTGQAIDIIVSGGNALTLLVLAVKYGFTGIGIQQKGQNRFLHFDDLLESYGRPRPWIWTY